MLSKKAVKRRLGRYRRRIEWGGRKGVGVWQGRERGTVQREGRWRDKKGKEKDDDECGG